MTDEPAETVKRALKQDLEASQDLYSEALGAIVHLINNPDLLGDIPQKERDGKIRELRSAALLCGHERIRYERARQALERDAPDTPVDFDAVRAEIGGHLDRIRAARAADGVPE